MSAPTDFDFLVGAHTVAHRRLRERLTGCTEWDEFDGTSTNTRALGGSAVVEDYLINHPEGRYRALGFRSFDPAAGTWAIWWLDGRWPHSLDPPVVGSFGADGIGVFEARETLRGEPIVVRYTWSDITADSGRWEQSFSPDGGESWEINWTMQFSRQS